MKFVLILAQLLISTNIFSDEFNNFVRLVNEKNNDIIYQKSQEGTIVIETGRQPIFSNDVTDAILAESATINNTYRSKHLGWVLKKVKYTKDGLLVSIWEH